MFRLKYIHFATHYLQYNNMYIHASLFRNTKSNVSFRGIFLCALLLSSSTGEFFFSYSFFSFSNCFSLCFVEVFDFSLIFFEIVLTPCISSGLEKLFPMENLFQVAWNFGDKKINEFINNLYHDKGKSTWVSEKKEIF